MMVECPGCNGEKQVPVQDEDTGETFADDCPQCDGTGEVCSHCHGAKCDFCDPEPGDARDGL